MMRWLCIKAKRFGRPTLLSTTPFSFPNLFLLSLCYRHRIITEELQHLIDMYLIYRGILVVLLLKLVLRAKAAEEKIDTRFWRKQILDIGRHLVRMSVLD